MNKYSDKSLSETSTYFYNHNIKSFRNKMKSKFLIYLLSIIIFISCNSKGQEEMKYNKLTTEEEQVILHKATERPFSGKYYDHKEEGTYICKQCNAPLFYSKDKFDSGCGWPSFDDEIPGSVTRHPDADGMRTEIVCSNCGGHLGHVFEGEGFTEKNIRHCVNSISMDFIPKGEQLKIEKAFFASGCFWGSEYHFQRKEGVVSTNVGYMGGTLENPTYEDVCSGESGHAELVEVLFDPKVVSYEELVRLFFETHNFSQFGGIGPDIGDQYRSEIFYLNNEQKKIAEKYVQILKNKNFIVSTKVTPASKFWRAENYHQNYYQRKGGTPYCHIYKRIF